MKAVKEIVRKYYKYENWTQPTLNSDGIMGGNSFACACSSVYDTRYAYRSFDGSNGGWHSGGTYPQWISWYNPQKLKVTSITINPHQTISGIIQASNDNQNWTNLKEFSISSLTNISLSPNEDYKYFRIYCTYSSYSYCVIGSILMSAQYIVETNSTDYEFYKDVSVYKVIKEENVRKYYKYRELEDGFKELTFLKSSSIDTGIPCTNKISFEYEAAMMTVVNWSYFLWNNGYSSGNWMISGYEDSSNGFTWHYLSTVRSTGVQPATGVYYKFSSDFTTSTKKYFINDVQRISVSDGTTRTLAGNILFGQEKYRCKYVKLFDENHNVIRNFVPCERFSDSTCGWYDTVNRQFYPAEITEKGDYIPEEGSSSNYDYYEESDMYLCVKSNKKGQVLHT